MEQEIAKQIEEVMTMTQCDKDFVCHKNNFENLCSGRCIGHSMPVDCSKAYCERKKHGCTFKKSFAGGTVCTCPVRIFVAKHLGK